MFVKARAGTRRAVLALLAVGAAAVAAGCGGDGSKLHKVTGKVSYNGQPVPEGRILFRNTGDGRAYSAPIADGAYEVMCEAGQMRVEIIASRVIPGKFKKGENNEPEPIPVAEMYIPTKYNSASTLTAEVKTSSTEIPFDLPK